MCVIEYVTGSRENWLKSCYLARAHSVCTEVLGIATSQLDTLLLLCALATSILV